MQERCQLCWPLIGKCESKIVGGHDLVNDLQRGVFYAYKGQVMNTLPQRDLHLVKDLHGSMHNMQLEELLGEVLEPEIYRPGRQKSQKRDGGAEYEDAEHIEQLIAVQASPAATERPHSCGERAQQPHREDREHSLRQIWQPSIVISVSHLCVSARVSALHSHSLSKFGLFSSIKATWSCHRHHWRICWILSVIWDLIFALKSGLWKACKVGMSDWHVKFMIFRGLDRTAHQEGVQAHQQAIPKQAL
jgi:hypothetical protein